MDSREEFNQREKDMLTSFTTQELRKGTGNTGSPAAPLRPTNGLAQESFGGMISKGWHKLAINRASRDYALDHGIDEQALEAYASGACSLYERKSIERLVCKCQWAMDYVTDLIKSRRSSE